MDKTVGNESDGDNTSDDHGPRHAPRVEQGGCRRVAIVRPSFLCSRTTTSRKHPRQTLSQYLQHDNSSILVNPAVFLPLHADRPQL